MKPALIVVGGLVVLALGASAIRFANQRMPAALLQLVGAMFLVVVVLAHVAETLGLFPWMGWGLPGSAGHYIDLISAVGGLMLFASGYLSHEIGKRRA